MIARVAPVFTLPDALATRGFALRPETDADIPFLRRLYASTREHELAQTDWAPELKTLFLAQQFDAQRHHYRTTLDCAFQVIERHGEPVGRLYLERRETQIAIVDITLAPEVRGSGTGGQIITALIATAAGSGRSVGIFVDRNNPALRLYRRLGFTLVREHEIYLEMEYISAPAGQLKQDS